MPVEDLLLPFSFVLVGDGCNAGPTEGGKEGRTRNHSPFGRGSVLKSSTILWDHTNPMHGGTTHNHAWKENLDTKPRGGAYQMREDGNNAKRTTRRQRHHGDRATTRVGWMRGLAFFHILAHVPHGCTDTNVPSLIEERNGLLLILQCIAF